MTPKVHLRHDASARPQIQRNRVTRQVLRDALAEEFVIPVSGIVQSSFAMMVMNQYR